MPVHFIDRSDPRNPVQVSVSSCRRGPHVTTGAPGNSNEPLCFSDTPIARPIKMSAGVRRALTKRLHQSGLHGQYASVSDQGLVALAHARRLRKNADASGRSGYFDSTPPANTSTQVPPAPSQDWHASSDRKFRERLRKHCQSTRAARTKNQLARLSA